MCSRLQEFVKCGDEMSEGGSFDPETVTLLRSVLDAAWDDLPSEQRALTSRTHMAERMLLLAAQGERDPGRLRASAVNARANRRIATETSADVDNMQRPPSSRFTYRHVVAFSAFCAGTAILAIVFFQPSLPLIEETKLNGCGDKAHLRGPSGTKGEYQWINDIYLA
jgi:hypothetical protein